LGWLHHKLESAAVPKRHSQKVTDVAGGDATNGNAFGQRHDRGIDQAKTET
jgi:hypothetical protein